MIGTATECTCRNGRHYGAAVAGRDHDPGGGRPPASGPRPVARAGAARAGNALRRRVAVIFSPAATTAAACSLPGERVRRSMGPETETAAMILPCPRTGADTDATPASRPAPLAAR